MKTEAGIVSESIEIDDVLEECYEIYQILLRDINTKNLNQLKIHLTTFKDCKSKYMKTAIKTLLDNYEYVKNSLIYKYSNGFTEGINNFIKVLKRIAFGYKSFFHFRNRILITRKLKKLLSV